jgi:hypothetical protein
MGAAYFTDLENNQEIAKQDEFKNNLRAKRAKLAKASAPLRFLWKSIWRFLRSLREIKSFLSSSAKFKKFG